MINKNKNYDNNRRVASVTHLRAKRRNAKQYRKFQQISICLFVLCTVAILGVFVTRWIDDSKHNRIEQKIETAKEAAKQDRGESEHKLPTEDIASANIQETTNELKDITETQIVMLPEYEVLYEQNSDIIGWLKIDGTIIDYPVMQTMGDEDYYLEYDFNKEENSNGCLIMDTDSTVGVGTEKYHYINGTTPSTNLIIHGHTMKSGMMFGGLKNYSDESYGREHRIINFDSLYEKREYELISIFYSQVYRNTDEVFKYYKFFQADTQEEFNDWYNNIKAMSLYETGVEAEFGDEFITLSCCSYQVEDGRFVVVGKRI